MTPELARIRLLLTDVDGVLTDGRIWFDPATHAETKGFHVHDAAGIVYWQRAGGLTGFVSGRESSIVERRAAELGVCEVHLGRLQKLPVLEDIIERRGLAPDEVAYIGDDVLDLPVLRRVGFSVAPCDARPDVRDAVDYVTEARGGFGAVRETIERLLRARGAWDRILSGEALP